jgi:hypothetical protein
LSLGRGRCNGSHVRSDMSARGPTRTEALGRARDTPDAKGRSGPLAARNGPDSLFDKPRSRESKRRRSRAGRKDGRHPRAALSYLRLPLLVLPVSATGRLAHLSRGGGDMCRMNGTRRGPFPSGRVASRPSHAHAHRAGLGLRSCPFFCRTAAFGSRSPRRAKCRYRVGDAHLLTPVLAVWNELQ